MSLDGRSEPTSKISHGKPAGRFLGPLRAVATIAVVAGAAGSLGFMLRVGRRNNSRLLLLLFGIWVLSPFMALILANVVAKGWSIRTRTTLYSLMLLLTIGSLAMYGEVALGPPRPKPASIFLLVPLASWVLIGLAVPIAGGMPGRLSRRGDRGSAF